MFKRVAVHAVRVEVVAREHVDENLLELVEGVDYDRARQYKLDRRRAFRFRVGLTLVRRYAHVVPKMALLRRHTNKRTHVIEIATDRIAGESGNVSTIKIHRELHAIGTVFGTEGIHNDRFLSREAC